MKHGLEKSGGSLKVVRDVLKLARTAGGDMSVVFHLRQTEKAHPGNFEKLAGSVVEKAAHTAGHAPKKKVVYANLGAMLVQGHSDLLLKILEQPEVSEAFVNPPEGGTVEPVRPVRKAPSGRSGWTYKA